MATPTAFTNQQLAAELQSTLAPLEIVPLDQELRDEKSIGGLRRRRGSRMDDSVGILTLLEVDGTLIWEEGAVIASASLPRRRRGRAGVEGEVVTQLKFSKELGTNEVAKKLQLLDQRLTPQGPGKLLQWNRASWTASEVNTPLSGKRALLIIHGTFSNSQAIMSELLSTGGRPGFSGEGKQL
jgi:hypothetical protein